uniref:ERV1/ALR-related protein n=1 Tax=Salmonella sp. s60093 TaxID=3159721 RepID=UPI0039813723
PVEEISKEFEKLIDVYPITPYLDNRDSFIRWTHFIHNKINERLEKPTISLNDFFVKYYKLACF